MSTHTPWHEALTLKTTLLALGVENGEIAFPGLEDEACCFVSENLSESPELTPSMARVMVDALRKVRRPLEGYSIRMEEGRMSVHEGDSGAFLVAWDLA